MSTTTHNQALDVLAEGVAYQRVGYTDSRATVGVIATDDAVDYLTTSGYAPNYARKVLSNASLNGTARRIGRGLYSLNLS